MYGTIASGCLCGKRMIMEANDGTCLWCGHGRARLVVEHAYRLNLEQNTGLRPRYTTPPKPRLTARVKWDDMACIEAYRRWEAEKGSPPNAIDWQQPMNGFKRPSYGTVYKVFGGWRAFRRAVAEVPRDEVPV